MYSFLNLFITYFKSVGIIKKTGQLLHADSAMHWSHLSWWSGDSIFFLSLAEKKHDRLILVDGQQSH